MATILITGAGGFTGGHLVARLQVAGHDLHCLAARSIPQQAESSIGGAAETHVCDLLDRTGLQGIVGRVKPQFVVHLAAIANVAHDDVDGMYRTNIVGTRNLLETLSRLDRAPERVLLASSANVYGNATAGTLDESAAPAPANDYAISKLAMEHVAAIWASRLPITIVRPFNYTGVGQTEDFLIPKIVGHFRRRQPVLELGNVDVTRDFSDVRTVVDCYARLLVSRSAVSVVNVCSGVGHTLREILELCESLSGHRLSVRVNPKFVRDNEVRTLVGSKRLLESVIGAVHPIEIRNTLEWMLG
jgi:nucleoside-diphosphate-sugar epimerase